MSVKYVVIIQCDIARERCSGFACAKSFYDREGFFKDLGYPHGTRYIAITCRGCCGGQIASLLEHFSNKLARQTEVKKDEVAIHLSTCMVTDNYHHDRCPNLEYIKGIVRKKGFVNIVDGTFRSANASKRRSEGVYKDYELEAPCGEDNAL
mgnify:FL=1